MATELIQSYNVEKTVAGPVRTSLEVGKEDSSVVFRWKLVGIIFKTRHEHSSRRGCLPQARWFLEPGGWATWSRW